MLFGNSCVSLENSRMSLEQTALAVTHGVTHGTLFIRDVEGEK